MTDAFDIHGALLVNSPDVRPWPITTAITRVRITPTNLVIDFDKHTGPNAWPSTPGSPAMGPLQYTVWLFLQIGAQWVGAGFIECWQDRDGVGDAPSDFAKNWYYGTSWTPMEQHGPIVPGNVIGLMVTAGDARNGGGQVVVSERSNIVTFTYLSDDADLTFAVDAPAPQPVPAPTPVPVDVLEEIRQFMDLTRIKLDDLGEQIANLKLAGTVNVPYLGAATVTLQAKK